MINCVKVPYLFPAPPVRIQSVKRLLVFFLKEKESCLYDFTDAKPDDFQFVKCANRRVRLPSENATYNGEGLKDLYLSGNIYVRLTRSFFQSKVYIQKMHLVHVYIII